MTDIVVTKTAETATTVTLEWAPVAGAHGYVFLYGNGRSSSTLDGTRTSLRIAKVNLPVEVRAGRTLASGVYPPPPATGFDAPAYRVTQQLNQKDPDSASAPGDHPTFGWAKSRRAAPGRNADWQVNGHLAFKDYPDEAVLLFAKQFEQGYPGATTNFHLVGGDGAGGGISPIRADWHKSRGVYEVVCQSHGDGTGKPYHWTIADFDEIDPGSTYTEEWHIRWRPDFTGYIHLFVREDGMPWKQVVVDNIRTQYPDQNPEVFVWPGAYESSGLAAVAKTRTTLDYRGRTLAEALADRPVFGSDAHSVSTVGGPDSSVVAAGTLRVAA